MTSALPQNLQSERAMIGCLAHAPDTFDTMPVTAEHFSHFATRLVFDAASNIFRKGGQVGYHTIASRLSEDDVRRIGGEVELVEMLRFVPAGAAPELFSELDRCLLLRRMRELSHWLEGAEEIATDEQSAASMLQELNRRVAGLETSSDAENILVPTVVAIRAKLDRLDSGATDDAFRTSIEVWNDAFGGILDGQFYALAGRPGRGKTAMMEQLIADYMAQEIPVVVFEKDMSPQKLIERIACRACSIPFWRYHQRKTTRGDHQRIRETVTEFQRTNVLRLYSPVGLTAERLCSIARREIRQGGARCVFLDHIQALAVGNYLREGFTAASLTLRRHVTETGVPLVTLAHLNREAGEGRPSPSSIKEFDQLYGDVDGMALLWHEADQADESRKAIKFFVAKNRDGGEGEDTLLFDGPTMTFKGRLA